MFTVLMIFNLFAVFKIGEMSTDTRVVYVDVTRQQVSVTASRFPSLYGISAVVSQSPTHVPTTESASATSSIKVSASPSLARAQPSLRAIVVSENNKIVVERHPRPPVKKPRPDGQHISPRPAPSRVFYISAGPESSGNRFLVSLLLSAGCYGKSDHVQPFDPKQAKIARGHWSDHVHIDAHATTRSCCVMHRSIPHGGGWPNLQDLVYQIQSAGFEPRLLLPQRADDATFNSQVQQGHVRTVEEARHNTLKARQHITNALAAMPHVWSRPVYYEQLGNEHYVHTLFEDEMGLTLPADHPRFEDRDEKHRT